MGSCSHAGAGAWGGSHTSAALAKSISLEGEEEVLIFGTSATVKGEMGTAPGAVAASAKGAQSRVSPWLIQPWAGKGQRGGRWGATPAGGQKVETAISRKRHLSNPSPGKKNPSL